MMLSIFSCVCWQFVYLLWRNAYLGLLPIFGLGCLFSLVFACMSCKYNHIVLFFKLIVWDRSFLSVRLSHTTEAFLPHSLWLSKNLRGFLSPTGVGDLPNSRWTFGLLAQCPPACVPPQRYMVLLLMAGPPSHTEFCSVSCYNYVSPVHPVSNCF